MEIILEGTEAEFINALHSVGIPNEVVFDDSSQPLTVGFIPDSDNDEIKALTKEQANHRRQVHCHRHS